MSSKLVRSRPLLISCWPIGAALTLLVASSAAAQSPAEDGRIHEDVDWALLSDDDLRTSDFERFYGIDPDTIDAEPVEQDGMLFGRDSNAASVMAQEGLPPLPAVNYEPTPGVLYVAMDGVTLRPQCGNGDSANAALDCSPLVDQETNFPAYGSASQQSALFQNLQGYYDPFDLVLTTNRPPEYLPYTMAVVGGSAGLAGLGGGVCGVANVACDGLKRNHVSLTFPQSCGGVAEIAAQETSHNWGLEHTDNSSDLMYPFNNGGYKTFVDDCMAISHATGNGTTQCSHIHGEYCGGDGEQQNSYGELMAIFGPRTPDTSPPQIVSFSPENGATMTTGDSFTVTAQVTEDSNFLGAKWTWIDGMPDEIESFARCTNKACDDEYGLGVDFDPDEVAWDFIKLNGPPEGTYTFRFEIMDAYGNSDSQELTFEVVPGEATAGNPTTASGGSDSGDGTATGGTGGGTEGGGTDGATGGTAATFGGMDDGGGKDGCACTTTPDRPWTGSLFGLLALGLFRRRS